MEIVKVIFLNDIRIVFFRQFQQAAFFLHGIRNACGCLEICHHIDKTRMVQLQIIFQGFHLHAVRFHGNTHQFCPSGQEGTCRTIESRAFHKDHISIPQNGFGHDVDALLGTGNNLQMFRRRMDTKRRQITAEFLPQGQISHTVRITKGTAFFPLQHCIKGFFEGIHRKQLIGQRCQCKIDGMLQSRCFFKQLQISSCHRFRHLFHRQRGNIGTTSYPRIHHLLLFQIFISRYHRHRIDTEMGSHFPNGW